MRPKELKTDVAISSGGPGGRAAARQRARVTLTEETGSIGGQLAQQGPPDEHPWIELLRCTGPYRGTV